MLSATVPAHNARKASRQDSTTQETLELLVDVPGQAVAVRARLAELRAQCIELTRDDAVEKRLLRLAPAVHGGLGNAVAGHPS